MADDPFELLRFVEAQAGTYANALAEITLGAKRGHWMWFVLGSASHRRHGATPVVISNDPSRSALPECYIVNLEESVYDFTSPPGRPFGRSRTNSTVILCGATSSICPSGLSISNCISRSVSLFDFFES